MILALRMPIGYASPPPQPVPQARPARERRKRWAAIVLAGSAAGALIVLGL